VSTYTADSRPLSNVGIKRRKFEAVEHEHFDGTSDEISRSSLLQDISRMARSIASCVASPDASILKCVHITHRCRGPRPGQVVADKVDSRDQVPHLIHTLRHDHRWYACERDWIPESLERLWGVQSSQLVAGRHLSDARERPDCTWRSRTPEWAKRYELFNQVATILNCFLLCPWQFAFCSVLEDGVSSCPFYRISSCSLFCCV